MDHIDQAVYDIVHSSDKPAKEIAALLGMSHQVLLNKANAQNDTHKLTLRESVAIQLITGDCRINRAVCLELDDAFSGLPGKDLINAVLSASKEHGDVVGAVQKSMESGSLTHREREECQKQIDEAILSLREVRRAVAAS